MRLTDLSIKALKAPETGAIIYPDDVLTGFGVRVSQAGTKSYVLTHGVCRQRETIGRTGIVSLQEARAEAKRRLAEYTLGKQRSISPAWNAALAEYLAHIAVKRKSRTHADYKRLLEKHFRFGETKMSDLTPRDIQQKIDKLGDTPAEQQHAFVIARAFIRWAWKRDYLDRNPMEKMEEPEGYKSRDRVLSDEELRMIWLACPNTTYGRVVKVLIVSGQRESEIANLTGAMVKGDLVTFPGVLTGNKNGIEHTFPVGPMTLALFPPLRAGFLFPARGRPDRPFNGWSKSKRALDQAAPIAPWRLHDFRRTLRTKWEELGISPAVSERYLNHVSGVHSGVQGIYNRYKYLPEMRGAVARWEQHLSDLTASEYRPRVLMGLTHGAPRCSDSGGRDAVVIEEAGA